MFLPLSLIINCYDFDCDELINLEIVVFRYFLIRFCSSTDFHFGRFRAKPQDKIARPQLAEISPLGVYEGAAGLDGRSRHFGRVVKALAC